MNRFLRVAALIALLAGVRAAHGIVLSYHPPEALYLEYMVVPSYTQMSLLSCGYRDLAADGMYIFMMINLEAIPREQRGPQTARLVDVATRLKPDNVAPYASAFLLLCAYDARDDAYRLADLAIERLPDDISMPYLAATEAATWERNGPRAIHYARIAKERDPDDVVLARLLAVSLKQAGNYRDSLVEWEKVRQDMERVPGQRASYYRLVAEKNIHDLTILLDIEAINAVAARFERDRNRPIHALDDLVRGGYLDELPVDPNGKPYRWDAEKASAVCDSPFRFKRFGASR